MISAILSRLVILLFGTLYPAYASYKAVRTKNVKEYVKWMMYWIVFALFTCAETFTDVFLSFWFPFYYEIKVVLVIWLLSPATKGSSILYRNFVHPALTKREQEIDEYISKAKEQGYHTMLHLGSKGVTYATSVIMQTAIKGGGGIVNHLRRSYSLSDLSADADLKADLNRNSKLQGDAVDTADVPRDSRMRTPRKPGGSHVDLYFPEMDVDIRSHPHHPHEIPLSLGQIRSIEDISSGYSSAEPLYGEGQVMPEGNPLMRTASVGATRARARGGRAATQPKKALTTEEDQDDIMADYGWQHALPPLPIASLFPELLNLDPSGLPPQAFLTPETLQILYANRVFRDHESGKVHEFIEEEEINMNSTGTEKIYEHFEVADKENILKKSDAIIEPSENITNNDKNEKSDEKIPFSEPFLPSIITNPENTTTEKSQELVSTPALENEVDISLSKPDTSESSDKIPEEHYIENVEQISERFEDASDAEVYASPTMENLFEQTHNKSEQLTSSAESVSSSEEQYFEDSLPDVTSVTDRDSLSVSERKGKYNKGRAPPPPEVKVEETEVTFEEPLAESSISTMEPDSSHIQGQMLKSDLINNASSVNDYGIYDGSRPSEQYKYETRDVSPTPSQSKKDGSNFSRFLPKASVTSLFNFWGSKDETPGSNKSKRSPVDLSRSPSNASVKSSSSGRFYKPSSPSNISNIQYTPDTDISRNVEVRVKTSPKLKIRQMSQSPSRRRHQNFD